MKNEELRTRFDALRAQRRTIEGTWDVIERFCAPYRGEMFRDQLSEHEIDWRRREVYDTTAIMAVQNLAAAVHGGMTNPKIKWFDLRFRAAEVNDDDEAATWLEECTDRIHLELQESDFDLEINEAYIDLTSFGSSVLMEEASDEENWDGVDFTAVPIKEIFFEMDHKGRVHRLYRRLQWTATQMITKFGVEGVPMDVRDHANNAASVDTKEEIIFCIYPRPEKKDADTAKKLAPMQRPFASKYIRHKDATTLGVEGGYYEMPAFVSRWRKTSESEWGNSPAMIALADVLSLNQLVEMDLRAREKAVDPPALTTERGLIGDLDLNPGGLSVLRSLDDLKFWDSGSRFDATNDVMMRLREQIKEVFFLDKLDLKESPEMTATEVLERTERMHRLLGPTVGRLQSDLLDPLVTRTFRLMLRAGQLPEMPQSVAEGDSEMDIDYLGPLARAQKSDKVQAIERFIGGVIGLAEAHPEVLDLIDFDAVIRESHEALSIPAAILKGQEAVDKQRAETQKMMQQQQQMMAAQQGGEAMKAVGEGAQAVEGVVPGGAPQEPGAGPPGGGGGGGGGGLPPELAQMMGG